MRLASVACKYPVDLWVPRFEDKSEATRGSVTAAQVTRVPSLLTQRSAPPDRS